MYEENKPSTLINDTRWGGHFFRAILVRSAMPNIYNNLPAQGPSKQYVASVKRDCVGPFPGVSDEGTNVALLSTYVRLFIYRLLINITCWLDGMVWYIDMTNNNYI